MAEIGDITREELQEKLERGDEFELVEVMPEEDYRKSHLPGAKHLPPDRVRETAPDLIPDRDVEVVVYCASPP